MGYTRVGNRGWLCFDLKGNVEPIESRSSHLVRGKLRDLGQQPAGPDTHVRAGVLQVVLGEEGGVVEVQLHDPAGPTVRVGRGGSGGGQEQRAHQLEREEADGFGGLRGVGAGVRVVALVLRVVGSRGGLMVRDGLNWWP